MIRFTKLKDNQFSNRQSFNCVRCNNKIKLSKLMIVYTVGDKITGVCSNCINRLELTLMVRKII